MQDLLNCLPDASRKESSPMIPEKHPKPHRQFHLAQREIAKEEIKNMLDQDIIETNSSLWASCISSKERR